MASRARRAAEGGEGATRAAATSSRRKRRELLWVPIEKDYRFETEDGTKSLTDLFDGRRASSASTQASIRSVLQASRANPFTFCAPAISNR